MRIISWNVNGIRATTNKGELRNLIDIQDPDILFMQEIKAGFEKLTPELLSPDPYIAYYNPAEKPGYAGTGVWIHSRVLEVYDVTWMTAFPGDPTANEGRVAHIELRTRGSIIAKNEAIQPSEKGKTGLLSASQGQKSETIDIFGIYFPNGGKSEDAWKGKIVFYAEFAKYMDELRAKGHAVLWGGDINCAHHPIDLARPEANDGKIGFHPVERAWLDGRVADGWQDIWRRRNPEVRDVYSWWDVITRSREKNVGWRIDAWWGSSDIVLQTKHIEYIPLQMGSDHCPMLIEI